MIVPLASLLNSFSGAIDFIFHQRQSLGSGASGGTQVGGLGEIGDLLGRHVELSALALLAALVIALPAGLYFGHRGKGELLAVALGNAGRAIPEFALIAVLVAYVGTGILNVTIALAVLGIPPILTNTFVGVRQVDSNAVQAARGMGMSEREIALRIELPLAAPTIMTGVRTAAINVIATATIAPVAGVLTLGDLFFSRSNVGDEGVLAGAIVVALLALTVELLLSALQRALTPTGVKLARARTA